MMATAPVEETLAYEVEIRFCTSTADEAYALLPFLRESLGPEKPWSTQIWGRSVFAAGKLLRVGYVPPSGPQRVYLGYKGVDEGAFANIRQEWGEEITAGIGDSAILAQLEIPGQFASAQAVIDRLLAADHGPFMDFTGVDRLGYVPALAIHTKLMRCPKIIGDQVMVELELSATSKEEAMAAEQRLQQLADEYGITDRLIREEPPTLLYQVSFP
ncbi:MAG: hypothetical protein KDE19_03275 [Caldilineaceae bacterium]|nr:hypothetical protein [Caldilineaceae bacterium]